MGEAGRFAFTAFGLSLSADGVVALWLAVPVTALLIALAFKIVRH